MHETTRFRSFRLVDLTCVSDIQLIIMKDANHLYEYHNIVTAVYI